MDERHWWFASKLQDTFHFSGYDNPSLLEDFLSDYEVSELISKFLGPTEPRKLFFFCEPSTPDDTRTPSLSNRQLHVTCHPNECNLSRAMDNVCLYVLRRGMVGDVDITDIDKEVYCGEIRQSVLVNLSILLSEAFTPILHQQINWGRCSNDDHVSFLQTFDRLTTSLHENASLALTSEQNLSQPSPRLRETLVAIQSQHPGRMAITNEALLGDCESLLGDWMSFIEGVLIEVTDERLEDPYGLPYSEREKSERKQVLLHSIIEQLKRKECTGVIATLAAGKSRLIKRWRTIDTQLTEAYNTSKDRVWYLTNLQQHFDNIQSSKNVSSISMETLPALFQSIKQMDGLSRLYANNGYLAILLRKVTNLITIKCQQLIQSLTTSSNDIPLLWDIISSLITTPDPAHQLPQILTDVIKLNVTYKEILYLLKDVLLHQMPFSKSTRSKQNPKPSNKPSNKQLPSNSTTTTDGGNIPAKTLPAMNLNNVDEILESLLEMADRADKILYIINYLTKLHTLQPLVIGLPRAILDNDNIDSEQDITVSSEEDLLCISIADVVSRTVCDIMNCFRKGCPNGTKEVFVMRKNDRPVFPLVYTEYLKLVDDFEQNVYNYLMYVFPTITVSNRGLDILARFNCISLNSKTISKAIRHCDSLLFRVYGKELEHLQSHYEQHKESPPLVRGQSRIAGSIEWARNILNRIQSPMDIFRHNDTLMKSPESHHICTLYNKLSTVLLQYEVLWLKQYKDRIDKTSSMWLSAPLLRLQDYKKLTKIVVNSDTGLMQVLGETRSLLRLGVPLSSSGKALLSQETRVKSFEQRLKDIVNDLYDTIDIIDARIRPLFDKVIDTVLRFFLPGWTTLTWSTLNIDAFLHQAEGSVHLLRTTIDQSNSIVTDRVYPVFDNISNTILIDKTIITSRPWEPEEFFEVVCNHIQTQTCDILLTATQCKTALLEVVTMVIQTEEQLQRSLEGHSNSMAKSIDYIKVNKDTGIKRGRKGIQQERSVHFSLPPLPEDKVLLVLGGFSQLLNNAVGLMVLRSYNLLCNCIMSNKGSGDIACKGSGDIAHKGSRNISGQISDISKVSGPITHKEAYNKGSDVEMKFSNLLVIMDQYESVQILVNVRFLSQSFSIQPSIQEVYNIITRLLVSVTDIMDQIQPWVGVSEMDDYETELVVDNIHTTKGKLEQFFQGLQSHFDEFVQSIAPLKILWEEDMSTCYNVFANTIPTSQQWKDKIMEFVELEEKVNSIPISVAVGPLSVLTKPMKSSLQALVSNWKAHFSSLLHRTASEALQSVVQDQQTMYRTISSSITVGDLPFLRKILELLLHVDDMFHHVDNIYSSVENMYQVLRTFKLILPRSESEQVDNLREKWEELTNLAANVNHNLLSKDRLVHEQECSKAVKEFIVKTIQFRNAFDTEGPLVPGLLPAEAVSRVGAFLDQSDELQNKRELLNAVQTLLSISNTPYPELDHTQEELSFLKALYNNYQNFIAFDESFRQTLWSEVDLNNSLNRVNSFWDVFLSLPQEQQNWEASHRLRTGITNYREILPLFIKLHSKEIRNRHWLQVMNVANCSFQLESKIFKMEHLISVDLQRFTFDIEAIISNACKEQELEQQFLTIEEKWSEQVLKFESHSHTSIPLLSQSYSFSLLEQLDSTQTDLALMLLSKHVHPLRSDCAQWAGKLEHISEVLQVWLNVQELWLSLQPVFSDQDTAMDFPDEAVVFSNITTTWENIMNTAVSIKSCIQCCYGNTEPVLLVLLKLTTLLEHCKKSLSAYLMEKRLSFPRLFYIPDDGLLTLLSNSESVHSVEPYLKCLFGGISRLIVSEDDPLIITSVQSIEGEELQLAQTVQLNNSVEQWLSSLHSSSCLTIQQLLLQSMDSDLPSLEEVALYHVTQVACASLYQEWNKECEAALSCCRYDRRALPGLRNKFNNSVVSKLNILLMRNCWKHSEEPVTELQRNRLENMTVLSLWLRDIIDDLCQRKIREPDDFEWKRFPRLIPHISGSGEQELILHCLDAEIPYCNEYLGCQRLPVFTPRTDAYFVSLTQTLQSGQSSCVTLPDSNNKTEIIQGVSYLIGQFMTSLQCTSLTDSVAITNYLTGVAQDGSWVCLCNIHHLSVTGLSILASLMNTIHTAIKHKQDTITTLLPHTKKVSVSSSASIFLTHSLSWVPPSFLSPLLRTFSIPTPDTHLVLRTHCIAFGLKGTRILINRLESLLSFINNQLVLSDTIQRVNVYTLCQVLSVAARQIHSVNATSTHFLPSVSTGSKLDMVVKGTPGRSPFHNKSLAKLPPSSQTTVQQSLPLGVVREYCFIVETISVLLGSRFNKQELPVFQSFLKDIFHDCPDIDSKVTSSSSCHLCSLLQSVVNLQPTRTLLETHADRHGLTCYNNWIDKVEQLYLLLKTNHATIIAGRECTGKTSALKTVISAMNCKDDQTAMTVKLQTMYPGVFIDVNHMFGCYDDSNNWRDGLFTSFMRKATKATLMSTWVSLDGPLSGEWTNHIEQLTTSKVLSLSNGELLSMNTATMKLIFETGDISSATPTILTHSGLVYFDSTDLSWRALATTWLKSRNHNETDCLQRVFDRVIDPVADFVLHKLEYGHSEREVALFETCLTYLSSLLNMYTETAEVFSDVHVERLFLFSVTWSYGGVLLREKEKRKFSLLLRQLSNSLPDDDTDYSVFDYYVDESGEWDIWQSKLPENCCQGVNLFGDVFVETVTTIRIEMLLELALTTKRHLLLVGPQLGGKTMTMNHFLSARALHFGKTESTKHLILNGQSTSQDIHHLMQVHLKHRQGYTYGPQNNRCLHLMLEDLHVTTGHSSTSHEYLRSIIDANGMFNLNKKNHWNQMEDILVFATMTSNNGATLDPRLKRHFCVIPVDTLSNDDLTTTIPVVMKSLTPIGDNCSVDVLSQLTSASIEVYIKLKDAFVGSNSWGRNHYMFSLQQLGSALQGVGCCSSFDDLSTVCKLWNFEMIRAFGSAVSRHGDREWLTTVVRQTAEEHITSSPLDEGCVLFSSISPNAQTTRETNSTTPLSTMPNIELHPLSEWSVIKDSVGHYVTRYYEELSGGCGFEVNENNIMILERVHRSLRHTRGNCLIVGSLGLPTESIARLALYIAGYTEHSLADDIDYKQFIDILRSVFRLAGLEGTPVGLILKESHLSNIDIMGTINSLISSYEIPTLFSCEEMEGLYHSLLPAIKKDFPSEQIDPEQYFVARICQNLRLISCVTPNNPILGEQASLYPGIFHQSHVIWIPEWTPLFLENMADNFMESSSYSTSLPLEHKPYLTKTLSNIHSFILTQSGSMSTAGIQPTVDSQPITETPGDITTLTPYGYLIEKMCTIGDCNGRSKLDIPYVGPHSLKYFMECLCQLYKEKNRELKEERDSLRHALDTLISVELSIKEMKASLESLQQKLYNTSQQASSLLKQLTAKSCQLERAKALCGQGGVVLSAMRMVSEQKRLMSENEEDDFELLAVFYDRLPRKSSRIDALIEKAKDQLAEAEKEEKLTRDAMMKTKEQAHYLQQRIDRNTIDQIKSLPNPPALVGVVMELMLTLLKRYGIDSAHSHTGNEPVSPAITRRKISTISVNSKMEREQWAQLQLAIGDSQRFLDLLNSLKWEDGLQKEAIALIESKLATSRNSGTAQDSQPSTADSVSSGTSQTGIITVAMAKYAAESAASMCGFAVAIVEYQYSFEPYRLAHLKAEKLRKHLKALEQETPLDLTLRQSSREHTDLSDVEEEDDEDYADEDLKRLETELISLQKQFDVSMMEKHSLSTMCQDLTTRVKLATNLLDGFRGCQEVWSTKIRNLPSVTSLLINCIISSSLLTYGGSLLNEQRSNLFNVVSLLCETEQDSSTSLTYKDVPSFLISDANLHHFTTEELPMDEHSLFNACIMTSQHTSVWPLIVNPLGMVEQWLRKRATAEETVFVQYKDLIQDDILVECLSKGKPLVIMDVNTSDLCHNDVIVELMRNKSMILRGRNPFKIKINGDEIECSKNFRLFMVTDDPVSSISPWVASLCSVVIFHPLCTGLESLLLEEFLNIHNTKTFLERQQLRMDIYDQILQTVSLEKQLLTELHIPEGKELELESKVINGLLTINKSYEYTRESLYEASRSLSEMTQYSLSTLILLARRASVITECVFLMSIKSAVYKTCYKYVLEVFKTFVKQSGSRIQSEDILSKLTKFGVSHFERSYTEADRELFLISTAIQIKINQGDMSLNEYGFLIIPTVGTSFIVKGLYNQTINDNAPVVAFGKKPFDWMSEKQWQKLLMLASNFEWVHLLLSSMGRDGKEMVWRSLSEGPAPETSSLVTALGQKLNVTEQLLLQCAFRPERLSQFLLVFASSVLDQKPLMPKLYEFQGVIRNSLPGHIPLIIYETNPAVPVVKLQHYAQKTQVNLEVINCFGCENFEEVNKLIERVYQLLTDKKQWVLLHNIHLLPLLMNKLVKLKESLDHQDGGGGKLWLSLNKQSVTLIPKYLLQHCLRVVIEAPKSPISSLTHTLLSCGQSAIINQSSRSEWLPLLHCLAMYHSILQNRRDTCWWSVGRQYNWTQSQLQDILLYISKEFASSDVVVPGIGGVKPVSWSGIRYITTEVIYGSLVTSSPDMVLLNAMADYWLHPGGPRKEQGLYHIPGVFYTPNTRAPNLIQAIELTTPPLVPSAELYGIHFTPEMELGNANYILQSLITISNKNKLHKTIRSPYMVIKGKSVESITSLPRNSHKPISSQTRAIDKLPSMIPCLFNLIDIHLDSINTEVMTLVIEESLVSEQIKGVLLTTVNKLIDCFPGGWRKDILLERLTKHNLDAPFTLFLMKETRTLNNSLIQITTDLQHLQTALHSSTNKYLASFTNLSQIALSLLFLKVPESWRNLIGLSSPPTQGWTLQEWLNDISQRYAFMDKVLYWGIERTPTYWLGAFFNPKQLLSTVFQSTICLNSITDQVFFKADLTTRDKDHIRDPPQEGIFLYGVYIWGVHFERSTNLDFTDTQPKSLNPSGLPLVHLTTCSLTSCPISGTTMESKPPYSFYAPCYPTRCHRYQDPLFYIKIVSNDIGSTKWSLRNVFCTLRPF